MTREEFNGLVPGQIVRDTLVSGYITVEVSVVTANHARLWSPTALDRNKCAVVLFDTLDTIMRLKPGTMWVLEHHQCNRMEIIG